MGKRVYVSEYHWLNIGCQILVTLNNIEWILSYAYCSNCGLSYEATISYSNETCFRVYTEESINNIL